MIDFVYRFVVERITLLNLLENYVSVITSDNF